MDPAKHNLYTLHGFSQQQHLPVESISAEDSINAFLDAETPIGVDQDEVSEPLDPDALSTTLRVDNLSSLVPEATFRGVFEPYGNIDFVSSSRSCV